MAMFYCKNCYKTFEVNILTPYFNEGQCCSYCGSLWTEYVEKSLPIKSIEIPDEKKPPDQQPEEKEK